MTTEDDAVIGGIDTHKHTHYAAVIDTLGRLLGHQQFPATDRGATALLSWMGTFGPIRAIGVESTGSFGANVDQVTDRSRAARRGSQPTQPRGASHGRQI